MVGPIYVYSRYGNKMGFVETSVVAIVKTQNSEMRQFFSVWMGVGEGWRRRVRSKKAQFLKKLKKRSKPINTQPVHAEQNLTERCTTSFKGLAKGRAVIVTVVLEKSKTVGPKVGAGEQKKQRWSRLDRNELSWETMDLPKPREKEMWRQVWMTKWRMCKKLQYQAFAGAGQQRHWASPCLLSDSFPKRLWKVCQEEAATPTPQPCQRAGMMWKTSAPGRTLPITNKIPSQQSYC